MNIHFIFALLLALAMAGCATDREKIVFLSDESLPKPTLLGALGLEAFATRSVKP